MCNHATNIFCNKTKTIFLLNNKLENIYERSWLLILTTTQVQKYHIFSIKLIVSFELFALKIVFVLFNNYDNIIIVIIRFSVN